MEMPKKNRSLLFLCIILSSFVLALSIILLTVTLYQPDPAVQNTTQTVSESQKDYLYCIREYEGKIGVFVPGQDTPIQMIETNPELLPEYDRVMLEEGIYLYSEAELRQLTEDFDG